MANICCTHFPRYFPVIYKYIPETPVPAGTNNEDLPDDVDLMTVEFFLQLGYDAVQFRYSVLVSDRLLVHLLLTLSLNTQLLSL